MQALNCGTEPRRVLLGGDNRHLHQGCHVRQPRGIGDNGGRVQHDRHQARLVIHQHQLAFLGV